MDRNKDLSTAGVSNVVGAVLLLALLITVIAAAKVMYIPQMKQDFEADHMNNALQDIMDHKARLDQASLDSHGAFVSTSVEMGGGDIPVVDTSRSSGTLKVDPAYGNLTVVAVYRSNYSSYELPYKNLGSFSYSSSNFYRPDQKYHYEDGMIIMSQSDDRSVISNPGIAIGNYPDLTLMMSNVRIDGKPISTASSGNEILTSALYSDNTWTDIQKGLCNVTINVTTDYTDEWHEFFDKEFTTAGLTQVPRDNINPGYNVTVAGRNVSAYVQAGMGKQIVLEVYDSDFITTIGNKVIPPVAPLPVPGSPSPTPTPTPSATPTPTPTPTPSPNALYLYPSPAQLKATPYQGNQSTTLQPFILLLTASEDWVQTPAISGTYVLQGPINVYLYEEGTGLLGLLQYQSITLYKNSVSPGNKIGSTNSFGTLLSVPGTGVSIVPATFYPDSGSVVLHNGDKLVLDVSYGGLLNLNGIKIHQSPVFISRIELVNPWPT